MVEDAGEGRADVHLLQRDLGLAHGGAGRRRGWPGPAAPGSASGSPCRPARRRPAAWQLADFSMARAWSSAAWRASTARRQSTWPCLTERALQRPARRRRRRRSRSGRPPCASPGCGRASPRLGSRWSRGSAWPARWAGRSAAAWPWRSPCRGSPPNSAAHEEITARPPRHDDDEHVLRFQPHQAVPGSPQLVRISDRLATRSPFLRLVRACDAAVTRAQMKSRTGSRTDGYSGRSDDSIASCACDLITPRDLRVARAYCCKG